MKTSQLGKRYEETRKDFDVHRSFYETPTCMNQIDPTGMVWRTARLVKCPECNAEFSLLWARAISCQGCPDSVRGCELARCPKCDTEWDLRTLRIVYSKFEKRRVAKRANTVLLEYYKDVGESPFR